MKNIKLAFALIAMVSCYSQSPLAATPKWANVFEKTVVFGASISANTMRTMGIPTAPLTGAALYGLSPAHLLAKQYAGTGILKSFAASFGTPTGGEQIEEMLQHEQAILNEASVIIGIDAFYWDAVWGLPKVEQQALKLIEFAKSQGKVLILGTVPIEVPENVAWTRIPQWFQDLLNSYDKVAWAPPQHERALAINQTLHENCLPKHNCYLVDIAKTVAHLNQGGHVQLASGKTYSLYDIRPDGVHVSTIGSQYICEQILKQFEAEPPMSLKPSRSH